MSKYPWYPNIHDIWYPWKQKKNIFSGKSIFPGSLIFREVSIPGNSTFTQNIHNVHISAIYDTQPRLMRQVMKYADDGRRRVICSRRPDSFAAGKKNLFASVIDSCSKTPTHSHWHRMHPISFTVKCCGSSWLGDNQVIVIFRRSFWWVQIRLVNSGFF